MLEALVGEGDGLAKLLDLARLLHLAHGLDHARARHKRDFLLDGKLQRPVGVEGEMPALESGARVLSLGQQLPGGGRKRRSLRQDHPLEARNLRLALKLVASVG